MLMPRSEVRVSQRNVVAAVGNQEQWAGPAPAFSPSDQDDPSDIRFFISCTPWKEEPEIGSSIYNLHRSIRRDRKIKGRSTKELTSNLPRGTGSRQTGQSQSCHSSGALSKEIKPILGFCVGSKQRKAMNRKADDI